MRPPSAPDILTRHFLTPSLHIHTPSLPFLTPFAPIEFIYFTSMDIPLPRSQEAELSSEHDACFHLESEQLLPQKSHSKLPSYRLSFKKSFEPILAQTLLKKTLNTSWSERHFLLTSTRLLYFADSSLKELKGCFILASLIPHRLAITFAPPEIWYAPLYQASPSAPPKPSPKKLYCCLRSRMRMRSRSGRRGCGGWWSGCGPSRWRIFDYFRR